MDTFGAEVTNFFPITHTLGTMDDRVAIFGILESVERLITEGYSPRHTIYLGSYSIVHFPHMRSVWTR